MPLEKFGQKLITPSRPYVGYICLEVLKFVLGYYTYVRSFGPLYIGFVPNNILCYIEPKNFRIEFASEVDPYRLREGFLEIFCFVNVFLKLSATANVPSLAFNNRDRFVVFGKNVYLFLSLRPVVSSEVDIEIDAVQNFVAHVVEQTPNAIF